MTAYTLAIFGFVLAWFDKYTFNENLERKDTRERERERKRERRERE